MIAEILVIGVIIVLSLLFLQFEHYTKRVKVVVIFIVLGLLVFSLLGLFNSRDVDLHSPKGIITALKLYVVWLGNTAQNVWSVGVEATGKVIQAVSFE